MPDVAVVTDTTAYLPEENVHQYGITVIPIIVNFEDGFIYDGMVNLREFFDRVERSERLPVTSQPPLGQFIQIYEKLVGDGKEVVSIHISSELSGTVESARTAAKMVDESKITVVDSLQILGPMGYQVLEAAEGALAGLGRREIVERVEKVRREISFYFLPATLDYLKKGGRIGGAEALLGTLLQIRPVLCIKDGRVEVVDKIRTWKKAVDRILQEMPRQYGALRVGVGHCLAPDAMEQVRQAILREAPEAVLDVWTLGPAIGIHIGPGAIGVG